MSPSVTEIILHCQKQIKKEPSQDKLLHYIGRLSRLKVGTKHLIDTGIGRTINQLSRTDGVIGEKAFNLVTSWKALVEAEKSSSESSSADEEEMDKPQILVNGHEPPSSREGSDEDEQDDEDDATTALPQVISYSRNADDSDNESDSSDRLCIDDNKKSDLEDEEEKFFPSSSSSSDDEISEPDEQPNSYRRSGNQDVRKQPEYADNSRSKKSSGRHHLGVDDRKSKSKSPSPLPSKSRKIKTESDSSDDERRIKDEVKHNQSSKSKSSSLFKKTDEGRNTKGSSSHHKTIDKSHDKRSRHESGKEIESKNTKRPKLEDVKISTEKKSDPLECLKPKLAPRVNVEIDSTSGINFSDVLSGLDTNRIKKQSPKKSPAPSTSSKIPTSTEGKPSNLPTPKKLFLGIETIESSKSRSAPSSSRNSPEHSSILKDLASSARDSLWDDGRVTNGKSNYADLQSRGDALAKMMSSRNQRTKVYSGVNRGVTLGGKVPKLFDSCLRVIHENIMELGYTGGIPYDILEPVLSRLTLQQLLSVESHNSYLIESTDHLWKYHCNQTFRGRFPDEMETWRELYFRCEDERSARFQSLTQKMKTKLEVATPLRKAKLAYVETTSGPKFNKSKAATIKTGMSSLKTREEKGPGRSVNSSASSGGSSSSNAQNMIVEHASVIITSNKSRGSSSSVVRESASSTGTGGGTYSNGLKKPKKAPLMQKTLKSMRTLMRR